MNFSTKNMVKCGIFSALIAIGAFINIPIPYVPITMQVFFVVMAGLFLGSKWGAISAGIYLFIGLIGIPIFTKGGGFSYVFQPTFGYLIGFVFGAFIIGFISERFKSPSFLKLLIASVVGILVIYAFGMTYFYFISTFYLDTVVTAKTIFVSLFLLLIPGDLISSLLGIVIYKKIHDKI